MGIRNLAIFTLLAALALSVELKSIKDKEENVDWGHTTYKTHELFNTTENMLREIHAEAFNDNGAVGDAILIKLVPYFSNLVDLRVTVIQEISEQSLTIDKFLPSYFEIITKSMGFLKEIEPELLVLTERTLIKIETAFSLGMINMAESATEIYYSLYLQ